MRFSAGSYPTSLGFTSIAFPNTICNGQVKLMSAMENPPHGVSVYIVPTGENANPNQTINGITQRIHATFGVLIMIVYDLYDDTGTQAYTDLQNVREEIINALLGFVPFDGADPIEHQSGILANVLPGVLMWSDDFNTAYYRFR